MNEYNILQYIFRFLSSLKIKDCQVAVDKLKQAGKGEKLPTTYCIASLPNGITDFGAYIGATGLIIIGAQDKTIGLPNINEITRVSKIIESHLPMVEDSECQLINFIFSSDNYDGVGAHEFYYTFDIYYSPKRE